MTQKLFERLISPSSRRNETCSTDDGLEIWMSGKLRCPACKVRMKVSWMAIGATTRDKDSVQCPVCRFDLGELYSAGWPCFTWSWFDVRCFFKRCFKAQFNDLPPPGKRHWQLNKVIDTTDTENNSTTPGERK